MRTFLRRVLCVLRGHDDTFHQTSTRLFMKCESCGAETPGFDLMLPPPVVRYQKILRFKKRMAS